MIRITVKAPMASVQTLRCNSLLFPLYNLLISIGAIKNGEAIVNPISDKIIPFNATEVDQGRLTREQTIKDSK